MAVHVNCEGNAVHIPTQECESCEQFRYEVEELKELLETRVKEIEAMVEDRLADTQSDMIIQAYEAVDNLSVPTGNTGADVSFSNLPPTNLLIVDDNGLQKTYSLVTTACPVNVRIRNATSNGTLSSYCIVTNINASGCHILNTATSAAKVRVSGYWLYKLTGVQ